MLDSSMTRTPPALRTRGRAGHGLGGPAGLAGRGGALTLIAGLVAAGLVAATFAGAQTVSPASIVFDPAAACGGGTDRADEVCITLPAAATCETVDVFLLFDDTGSFTDNVTQTGAVFGNIVSRLRSDFPGVSFAYGVGRFEDFGGPWDGSPNRPFFLNQALLEESDPGFAGALAAALSPAGKGPGDGGDSPETAIEALFQVATGRGLNGNPDANTSVRDSGPAGAPATWTAPDPSGDVPDFASYVGSASGTLGGAGWRADSCLRLALVATDWCTVAPFSRDQPIPAAVTGTGGTVAASAFRCGSPFVPSRFGPVSDAVSETTVDGVAPVGAATVPATVDALNDLGIRVIGLAGRGRASAPADKPSTFLSALARLTGAVDAAGAPLVFDLGSGGGAIENALVGAVSASLRAPLDIVLVPDPEVPGLTVTAEPPVREGVGPGEEACFAVRFAGDSAFAGGNLGLGFVDAASGGSLGMPVPTTLRCPGCFDRVPRRLLCNTDASGVTTGFTWTFLIRNRSDDDIHHLFFVDLPAGVRIEPRHLTFSPPIRPNQPRLVTVEIKGATPGTALDFRITLHDAAIDQCCAEEVHLELPACDCAQLLVDRNPSCFHFPGGFATGPPWRYRFDLENLASVPVDYLLLAPVSPADRLTPVSPAELVIDPNVLLPASTLGAGDETGLTTVAISGPAARPGEEVCFRLSTHDAGFGQCCSIVKCLRIPDCFFGPLDLEPLGSAILLRSGDTIVVSEIGDSGGDGAAATFGPAAGVEWSLAEPSAGVDLEPGATLRFAARGTAGGALTTVAGVTATLTPAGVVIAPDADAPSTAGVSIFAGDELVATGRPGTAVTAVDGRWPTRFAMEGGMASASGPAFDVVRSGLVAEARWSEPVTLSLGGDRPVAGDRVIFRFAGVEGVEGISRGELTAAAVDALVIKGIDLVPAPTPLP